MRTASPTSRTIVLVRGGLLPADLNGRHSSDNPKRYTGARDTTFACSARNNWIPKRDGYTHTYIHTKIQTISEMRRRISCLALRRSAIIHTRFRNQLEILFAFLRNYHVTVTPLLRVMINLRSRQHSGFVRGILAIMTRRSIVTKHRGSNGNRLRTISGKSLSFLL